MRFYIIIFFLIFLNVSLSLSSFTFLIKNRLERPGISTSDNSRAPYDVMNITSCSDLTSEKILPITSTGLLSPRKYSSPSRALSHKSSLKRTTSTTQSITKSKRKLYDSDSEGDVVLNKQSRYESDSDGDVNSYHSTCDDSSEESSITSSLDRNGIEECPRQFRGECIPSSDSDREYETLPLEYWERSKECKEAKWDHMERLDNLCESRERLVLLTTLWDADTVLETNMFPYDTPKGVEHFTLWSVHELSHQEVINFVDNWLKQNMPQVKRWEYDDNSGQRSIDLFHVHVFIETIPYSYCPSDMRKTYRPLHSL